MGELVPIEVATLGCPSGLQETPVSESDPLAGDLDLSTYVRTNKDKAHIDLIILGAHCAGCISKIENGLTDLPGLQSARINLSTSRLSVDWKTDRLNVNEVVRKISALGFGVVPYEPSESENIAKSQTQFLLRCMAVAGFATMNVMLLSISVWASGGEMQASTRNLFHWISAFIAIPAVGYAGRPFFFSAWQALKNRQTNMDVPISLAMLLALSLSIYETLKGHHDTYFDAAVMLVFLLLIGRYLDALMRARTGDAARKLAALQMSSATRILPNGKMETVPAKDINIGETVFVPVGQRLAVDGEIISGASEIDTQIATGESVPRHMDIGDHIYSGMINLTGPLKVKVQAAYENSFLSEITRLVEIGEQSKSTYVQIADKAARAYVPVVHSVAVLTFLGWLLMGADLRFAALCAIAVLIITCPCALGLAVPAVNVVTVGELFKRGVLVRSGDVLERLSEIDLAIFDKTGTLTQGKPSLVNVDQIDATSLALASALARHSTHPLSKALKPYDTGLEIKAVNETPGLGLSGLFNGQIIKYGSTDLVGRPSESEGMLNWLRVGDEEPIKFEFKDKIRAESAFIINNLNSRHIGSHILSGDRHSITKQVADRLAIKTFRSEASPSDKLEYLNTLESEGHLPMMIGDGINDAPALAAAHVSVSLASASDISRNLADVILQHDSLEALPDTLDIASRSQKRIKENLGLAVIYNMFAIPLAVFGFVTPLIAAVAMSVSSLIVVSNALRMKQL